MNLSRIQNRWPFAIEGIPFILMGWAITALFLALDWPFPSILMGLISLFITSFFRDPDRKIPQEEGVVLVPADGKVLQVKQLPGQETPLGEPAVSISIFMSVFNVHVNRAPVGGAVRAIRYRPGKFFSANLDKASQYNENNSITIELPDLRKVVLIQIAGLIARRIACWVAEGDRVLAGQRFGLIRFGSRVEVYLPSDTQIAVQQNQKVKAGETVLGYLSKYPGE